MGGSVLRLGGRLAGVAGVVVGVTALTWLAMRVLRPSWFTGDPRPVPTQLVDYLDRGFLHFDLGRTFRPPQDRVAAIIRRGLPADFSLLVGGTVIGVLGGTAAGTYCAAPRGAPSSVSSGGGRPARTAPRGAGRSSRGRSRRRRRSSSSRRCTCSGSG